MTQAPPHDDLPVYDLVGVGFGPSNLGLALAVAEHNARPGTRTATTAVFLERQPRFGWHRGMLIDDATMQVSFLKDLVTLRNPCSRYSFLCYLQSRDRLVDFVNHKKLFPLRVEFHDYLEWAAGQVDDVVAYGHEVVGVDPVVRDGRVRYLDVTVRGPHGPGVYRARNLVLAPGLQAHLPDGVELSDRIWHNRDLLHRVDALDPADPHRFVVVGAGQSAAEVVAYLHTRFTEAEVCSVFARYGYSPADDSAFANRIFDPAAVDDYFGAPAQVKQLLLDYHGNTNYSVVDSELIEALYTRVYQEKVLGRERLRVFNVARLAATVETNTGVRATVESLATGAQTAVDADVVVYATGYRPTDPSALLGDGARYCHRDEHGRLRVARDYRVETTAELECGIYLQGGTEHTHGITSSLLSNTAVRAGEILQSITARGAAAYTEPRLTGSGIPA